MTPTVSPTNTLRQLIALAAVLGVAVAVALGIGNGTLRQAWNGTLSWDLAFLNLCLALVTAGGILQACAAAWRPALPRHASTIASASLGVVLALALGMNSASSIHLQVNLYFTASVMVQGILATSMAYTYATVLNVSGRWPWYPALASGAALALFGLICLVGQSWLALDVAARMLPLVRDGALAGAFVVWLACLAFAPGLRLDPASAWRSLQMRLPTSPRQKSIALGIGLAGLVFSVIVDGLARDSLSSGQPGTSMGVAIASMSWCWVGLLALAVHEISAFGSDERRNIAVANLTPLSARRFLMRHQSPDAAWATTVGLRTGNFSIDHDPSGALQAQLPASILQIRNDEIQRCLGEILGPLHLHSYIVGQRIFGALDPEATRRPGVDSLKMFACLYLDAGPLVERRIEGLAALLPIVDPGLARVIQPLNITNLIRRNLWLFHLDYGWIDQFVIHTPRATRYDVRLATIPPMIQEAMLGYMEKSRHVGNVIWLSPEARERVLQEAPFLKSVIDACPLRLEGHDNKGTPSEVLMFVIKFETLIPRLQRYFDLDALRQVLLDFEPSPESSRLLNLLRLQLEGCKTTQAISAVLQHIASVSWRGFREKDLALQLVLLAYEKLGTFLTPGRTLREAEGDAVATSAHAQVLDAIRAVGYPSQVLHHAQVKKLELRAIDTLIKVATDSQSPRYAEAWLLLAATDFSRYSQAQRRVLIAFIEQSARTPVLAKDPLVQIKALDALAGIGRVLTETDEISALQSCVVVVIQCLAAEIVDIDTACLLFDTVLFLSSLPRQPVQLSPELLAALDGINKKLTVMPKVRKAQLVALNSRWQDLAGSTAKSVGAA